MDIQLFLNLNSYRPCFNIGYRYPISIFGKYIILVNAELNYTVENIVRKSNYIYNLIFLNINVCIFSLLHQLLTESFID